MNKRLLLTLTMLLTATLSWAAAKLTFGETNHDFGTIQEKDGDVSVEFKFSNTGDQPLLIVRAASSCGCTVPDYPKKPIRPGQEGVVKVTYHAKGRPGPFQKSIYVYDNTDNKTMLTISGNVIDNSSPSDTYVTELGAGLRVKNQDLNFFDVYPNRTPRTRTLHFYNESEESLQLTFRGVSKNLYLECEPEIIEPKKEGKVLVTFLTDKTKDWGLHRETFEVLAKGKETLAKNNTIRVTADIWEDFSNMKKSEREQAPEIEIEQTRISFNAKGNKTMKQKIEILNTGKSKMTIRKIQNDLPEVFEASMDNMTIKAGSSATLTVTYHPDKTKLKNMNHHITVICNDPTNSRVIINIEADK